jgi:predicted O-methyltransferase YrrM
MNIEEKREDFLKSYFDSFKQIFPELIEEKFLNYYDEVYELGLLGYPQKQGGSMWTSELQNLYVLIRLLKPKNILELGNFIGVSSNGILSAVKKNDNNANVVLVDIEERLQYENLCSKKFTR